MPEAKENVFFAIFNAALRVSSKQLSAAQFSILDKQDPVTTTKILPSGLKKKNTFEILH